MDECSYNTEERTNYQEVTNGTISRAVPFSFRYQLDYQTSGTHAKETPPYPASVFKNTFFFLFSLVINEAAI